MSDHEREAEWRWGNGDAYRESMKRTNAYRPEQWAQLQSEGKKLLDALATLKRSGAAPTSAEAMAIAEMFREYNSRWFYETDHQMHALLAEGYVSDARFKKFYDDIEPGLAEWYAASIRANAERVGASLTIDDALAAVRANMGFDAAPVVAHVEGKMERRARELAAKKR